MFEPGVIAVMRGERFKPLYRSLTQRAGPPFGSAAVAWGAPGARRGLGEEAAGACAAPGTRHAQDRGAGRGGHPGAYRPGCPPRSYGTTTIFRPAPDANRSSASG
ncbi:hypothetical protein GCM10027075_65940 [Streptomyces heilongjiangensis]